MKKQRVRSFGMIRKRITDPRSLGSRCIKGTDESTLGKDSSVPLMHHDPSDLGSVSRFRIIPKERSHKENSLENITWSEMGKQNVQAKEVY